MVPYIDTSGPTLTINVQFTDQDPAFKLLLAMSHGTVSSPLPRFAAIDLEENGILFCKLLYFTVLVTNIHSRLRQTHAHILALTRIPIRLHVSDRLVLNKNQDSTAYMLTLLGLISTDRYSSIFAFNRCLYRKFILL